MEWEGGPRGGVYVYILLIHFVVQEKLTQHCKPTIPQLKKKEQLLPNPNAPFDCQHRTYESSVRSVVLTT